MNKALMTLMFLLLIMQLQARVEITNSKIEIDSEFEVPDSLFLNTKVDSLIIKHSFIERFHNNLESFTNLKYIEITGCKSILNWDSVVFSKSLEEITITECKLTYIPYRICKLLKIKKIDVSKNPINKIPEELYSIKSLEKIVFFNTKVESLSNKVAESINLAEISFYNTDIRKLPKEIKLINSLKKITVPNTLDRLSYWKEYFESKNIDFIII